MQRRHWYFILLAVMLWAGYKLFYKHRPANTVPAVADGVAVLDVKRLANSLIWEFITTPALWKSASLTPGKDKYEALTDLVDWPDYILAFHLPGEPAASWYSCLPIKDSSRFAEELVKSGFEKAESCYRMPGSGLSVKITGKQVLAGTPGTISRLDEIADMLFREQKLLATDKLENILQFRKHAAVFLRPGLSTGHAVSIHLSRKGIRFSCILPAPARVTFRRYPYHYNDSSLCTLAFPQADPDWATLLPDSARRQITRLLGYEPDTLLAPGNLYYELDLQGFSSRTDTIVEYAYNDQFEAVETKRTQQVWEPVFNFGIQAPDAALPFRQMLNNHLLTHDTAGYLFTPLPFVKSYARVQHAQKMVIHSWQYPAKHFQHTRQAVLYGRINPEKIPAALLAWLPPVLQAWLPRIQLAEIQIDYNEQGQLQLDATVFRKNREGSSLDW